MDNRVLRNIVRIVLFVLVQVIVFKSIELGAAGFNYIHLIVYPVTILLLPIDLNKALVIVIAFLIGITVDVFYDSPGVHAGALVFMAFLRPTILRFFSPETGYSKEAHPVANSFGLPWFMQYSGILLLIFLFVYFSLEAFTFVYIGSILLKTILSFIASFSTVILHQILFNPKY